MSFEVFLQSFDSGNASKGLVRAEVRRAFGKWLTEESASVWRVEYGPTDFCVIYVDEDPERMGNFMVSRPVTDERLWNSLLEVMRLGNVLLYWPGGSVVADRSVLDHLPVGLSDSLATVVIVSVSEILSAIKGS